MYGIVNKAIHGLVEQKFGKKAWQEIADELKLDNPYFLSSESYPDHITYDLVRITSEKTGCSTSDIMNEFGEYWILNTGMQSYGSLMKAGGADFKEFMTNLPNFHSRVMLIYPKLTPPEFHVTDICSNSLKLHYYSTRQGLVPFVNGLINGIAKMYKTSVNIKIDESNTINHQRAVFTISW